MPELGKTLAQARVDRGLTLEDCERDTRISKRYLDALEREDWKIFPAPVYSRAFLRTYAQYLALDPQAMMRMFQAQPPEPELKPLPEIRPADPTGSVNWLLAGGVVIFLLVAGIFLWQSSRGGDADLVEGDRSAPTSSAGEGQGGGPLNPALGRPVGDVKRGEVPDLEGVRLDDALAALDQAGVQYLVIETQAPGGQPGVVLSQTPEPGTKANSRTAVTILVPRG